MFREHPDPQHSENWVMVSNTAGEQGYVPKSYVYVPEGLPWLQNKKIVS